MRCESCQNWCTKTTVGKGHFLLFGCRKLKITFGSSSDWFAKKNQPKNCHEYLKK